MDTPDVQEINGIQGHAVSCTCFIAPESTKTPLFLSMATPSACPLPCIPGAIVCAGHVLGGWERGRGRGGKI